MTYLYYCPVFNELFITEYHWGMATTMLPIAFDGEITEDRRTRNVFERFEYIGRV